MDIRSLTAGVVLLGLMGCGDDDGVDLRMMGDAGADVRMVSDVGAVLDESVGPSDAATDRGGRDLAMQDGDADGALEDAASDAALDDAALADMAPDDAATPRMNPDVELIREITFEQADGTNGWEDPASLLFNWRLVPTGRDRVPDAMLRMATGINVPSVVNDVTYRGGGAARLVMQPWGGGATFRQDMEMLGDLSNGVDRRFRQGETHVVGFAMRIEHATYRTGGFQLYHQYHNGSPPKSGYGTTNNPALSLLRANDNDLVVAIRDNRPGGNRLNTFETIPGGVRAGQWVRWVFKTRFSNFDSGSNGLVEVWSAVGDEPLEMNVRVDDRPVGYVYENPAHAYEAIVFDMYGAPMQDDAVVYVDEVRMVDADAPPSSVDPLSWVSYQHPLNAPYNDDLR